MPRWSTPYIFLIASTLVCVTVFLVTGPYNMRVDGKIYLSQVEQFEEGSLVLAPYDIAFRAFKPFSGVFGSFLVPVFSPIEAMQLMNILFVFGLPFVCYAFFKELGLSPALSRWGALWAVTGYPVLKYGLAISTDMGGWFFALMSAFIGLRGLHTESYRLVALASLIGFLGGTIKETGVFGLLFLGLYILFSARTRSFVQTARHILALVIPALMLEITLFAILMYAGFPSFIEWYSLNTGGYHMDHYTFTKFVGVEVSTFGIVLAYAFFGGVLILKRDIRIWLFGGAELLALVLATAPVFLWPIFISRIMFIQILWMIPLALIGMDRILDMLTTRYKNSYLAPLVCVAPMVGSVLLYVFVGNESLSTVLNKL